MGCVNILAKRTWTKKAEKRNNWMVDLSSIIDSYDLKTTKFRLHSLGRSGPVKKVTIQNVLERILLYEVWVLSKYCSWTISVSKLLFICVLRCSSPGPEGHWRDSKHSTTPYSWAMTYCTLIRVFLLYPEGLRIFLHTILLRTTIKWWNIFAGPGIVIENRIWIRCSAPVLFTA